MFDTYILACPFCGKQPIAFGSGEQRRGLMIQCVTEGCVNPHVSYYNRRAAAVTWNRRVDGPGRSFTEAEINETSPL